MSEGSARRTGSARREGSSRRLRVFLGAFGEPGHAFPMLALGARLAARGHEVSFETWKRWREHVEAAGMRFVAAPEYPVFPTRERPLRPWIAGIAAHQAPHRHAYDADPPPAHRDLRCDQCGP